MTNPTLWDSAPITAFAAFVASADFTKLSQRRGQGSPEPVSKKSALIYSLMFGKFAHWLADEHKLFSQVNEQDLLRFIGQYRRDGQQNSLITQRYLRLLERCYQHVALAPNPASAAITLAKANNYIGKDEGTEALTPEQVRAFLDALPCFETPTTLRKGHITKAWKRSRDHAMLVTILYSGLRVAETIGLLLSEVEDPFGSGDILLRIRPEAKHDTSYEHETILPSYAAQALRNWLEVRTAHHIGGQRVFPADRTGRPMTKMTVYRQVQATFVRAGIDVNRSGGRTLRNTFAAQQLKQGTSKTDLQQVLGLALERSAEIYALAKPRKGQAT